EIEQYGKASAGSALARALVVLRRQPDRQLAHVRIAQRVVLEHLGCVLQHDERPGLAGEALDGHRSSRMGSGAHCSAPCGDACSRCGERMAHASDASQTRMSV